MNPWTPEYHPREQVIYRCGSHRIKVTVLAVCEKKDVYKVELAPGSYADAHKVQLRRIKKPERFFIARYAGETIYANGLSVPKATMEDAAKRPAALEILEVEVIKRHPPSSWAKSIPERPAFLAKPVTQSPPGDTL